jgi:ElaB/YqjD/DUF883 family membrane-anchored ribosome-binding protein
MSDQDPNTPITSRGAIDESRRGTEQRTTSGTGDPNWSGINSGAESVMPQGASAAGTGTGSGTGSGSMQDQVKEQADKVISTATQKMGGLADQATSSADAGIEKAAGGLDTLAGTIRDKSQSLGGGQMESIATTTADKLASGAEMLRGQNSDQLVSELEALVRRKPMESLLVAAGVGFVLSKALR